MQENEYFMTIFVTQFYSNWYNGAMWAVHTLPGPGIEPGVDNQKDDYVE